MLAEILEQLNEFLNYISNNTFLSLLVSGMILVLLFGGTGIFHRYKRKNFFKGLKARISSYTSSNIDLRNALKTDKFDIKLSTKSPLTNVSFMRFLMQAPIRHARYGGAVLGTCDFYSSYRLSIQPKTLSLGLLKEAHLAQFTPIGDSLIDKKFYVTTNNLELTKKILQDEELRNLILTSKFLALAAESKMMRPAYPFVFTYTSKNPTPDEKQNFNILVETKVDATAAFQAFLLVKRLAEVISNFSE